MNHTYVIDLFTQPGYDSPVRPLQSAFVSYELVKRAYENVLPKITKIIEQDSVPGLSIVVLDPARPYSHMVKTTGIGAEIHALPDAILYHTNMGNPETWRKFDHFALGKALVCWVFEENSGDIERTRHRKGDCSYPGGIIHHGVVVAVSGHPHGEVDEEIGYLLADEIYRIVLVEYESHEQPAFFK